MRIEKKSVGLVGVVVVLACMSVVFTTNILAERGEEEEISVESIHDPAELFSLAASHFGGDVYNLTIARTAYERQLKLDPDYSQWTLYQLGRIDFLEGKFRSALRKFEKQQEYFPETIPDTHYMIGLTYGYLARRTGDQEDWKNAERGFSEFIKYHPDSPWAKVDLAWVYFSQGKYEEMKQLLEESLDEYIDNPWYVNMYGLALLNTDKRALAHEYFIHAEAEAAKLTVEDWGKSYPGNDPESWEKGLSEMREAVMHNRNIAM